MNTKVPNNTRLIFYLNTKHIDVVLKTFLRALEIWISRYHIINFNCLRQISLLINIKTEKKKKKKKKKNILRRLDILGRHFAMFTRKMTFYERSHCTQQPFITESLLITESVARPAESNTGHKVLFSKIKEFAPEESKFCPFRRDTFSEGRQISFDIVVSR